MYSRAGMVALFLQVVLPAGPQSQTPVATAKTLVLKSSSHVVQLHVVATDANGLPVHGLQKSDFVLTDNGHPRDIRIFSGEIDVNRTMPSPAMTEPSSGVYSNRLGMRDWRMVTAIVIDAARRPEGLQKNDGVFANSRPEFWFNWVRVQARRAIQRMQPGQAIAIYAACPELRIIQDFTSDPDRLIA